MYFSCVSFLSFLSVVVAVTAHQQHHVVREGEIDWTPCNITGGALPAECGRLMVPLDYTNEESCDKMVLPVQRVPAAVGPKKGSILLNFGGPGTNGTGDFALFAPYLQAATGGAFDLINVVPRGTSEDTLPFECYETELERRLGFQFFAGNASDAAIGTGWAVSTIIAENCAVAQSQTGELIGTAFVARDLMQVVDALHEDGLLRYWGVSYGTLLGATVASMFPDRMDKVVLDGVVNPYEYYQNVESETYDSTDAAFRGFCAGCVANPQNCTLAQNRTVTAEQLEGEILSLLETVKYKPVPIISPNIPEGGQLIDYTYLKYLIFLYLYKPYDWTLLANIIARVKTGAVASLGPVFDSVRPQDPQLGIKCGDVATPNTNLSETLPALHAREERSAIFGDVGHQLVSLCAQWALPAKERNPVPLHVKTKNPILVIGNTFDPVTPLVSARNVSAAFEGSGFIHQDSYGHDSLVQASFCTASAVRSYFINGTLPEKDTVCDVKIPLFSGSFGWEEVIPQLVATA